MNLIIEITRNITSLPEWITAIATTVLAILTFITILIALFYEDIKKYRNRPIVNLIIGNKEPFIIYNGKMDLKYFRLKVKNTGKTLLKNCRLKIIVSYPWKDSNPHISQPITLKWSNSPVDSRYLIQKETPLTAESLKPIYKEERDITPNGGWELCDLFRIAKGGSTINFISSMYENRFIQRGNRDYIFYVEVMGDNIVPRTFCFKIKNNPEWDKVSLKKYKDGNS